jgi:endonuclease/exonuclease/phosphatase (EEP) superfamily protein YafD
MRARVLGNLRSFVVFLVVAGGLGASALVVAAPWHWAGELAASFRWQLGWLGVVAGLTLALLRARWAAPSVVLLALWLLSPWYWLYVPRGGADPAGSPLRVATMNVAMFNRDGASVRAWIRAEDPEVVAVQEVDGFWLPELQQLGDLWPHRVTFPADEDSFHARTFGMALLSKRPMRALGQFSHLGRSCGLVAEIDIAGESILIVAAHPERPGRSERVPRRNAMLDMIAERARTADVCIVLGDLNTSSGSPAFGRLLRDGRLHDSRRGFGRQPTWRTYHPIPGLWVDIDHILVGARFSVADRRVGSYIGSDHRPVVADLILRTKAADAGG